MMFKKLRLNAREMQKYRLWSKESIYETFVLNYKQLVIERREANRLRRVIAGLELDLRRAGVEYDND